MRSRLHLLSKMGILHQKWKESLEQCIVMYCTYKGKAVFCDITVSIDLLPDLTLITSPLDPSHQTICLWFWL